MRGQLIAGKYELFEMLGKGGMGAVYLARHAATGRNVAVKLLTRELLVEMPDAVARFEREARAAGALGAEHVVQVIDAGTDAASGLPYLVMEYLQGESLGALFRRLGPLPTHLAVRIAAQALVGLAKAHDAGVVHRDIKPDNIFLARKDGGERTVKILDFGIAKVKMDNFQSAQVESLTRTGNIVGTPHYMSPEQAQGLKSLDHRTDLWSVGVTLYKMLCGRTPTDAFDSLGKTVIELVTRDAPPIQDFAPWVSPELATVLRRVLSRNPAARHANAEELLADLRPLMPGGLAIREEMLTPLTATQRAQLASRVPPQTADEAAHATLPSWEAGVSRRGPARLGLVALALALAVAGGAFAAGWLMVRNQTAAAPARSPAPVTTAAPATPAVVAPSELEAVLRINPPTARVEVDAVAVDVVAGEVRIRGRAGTVHHVTLEHDGVSLRRRVVLTESGALPSELSMPPREPAPVGTVARPSSKPRGMVRAVDPAAVPSGKKPETGLQKEFE